MKTKIVASLAMAAALVLAVYGWKLVGEKVHGLEETAGVVGKEGGEGFWMTDFEAATEKARAENKAMLLDFTGSDWCGWCVKLKKEVFTQPEFIAFADRNLVLVMLDFPRKPQSEPLKAQNQKLQRQFGIQGFPTIILLGPDGKELARTGYRQGGAAAYVEHLKELMRKQK